MSRPIAVLYEHPEWFRRLFAELDRRGSHWVPVPAQDLVVDPSDRDPGYALVVNRMSPSAWTRGNGHAIPVTLRWLEHLESAGVDVLNGATAFRHEISKAAQLDLFERLGVAYPRARVIGHRAHAARAAEGLRFPVVVKPNVGGSGAGIRSFASPDELAAAADTLDLGPDGTALVQEHLPAAGDEIVRVEVLGGRVLYAIKLRLEPGTFNLCPADYCRIDGLADGVSGRGLPIERYEVPAELGARSVEIVAASGAEVGGVEYLVDARDGEAYFYDVNALSNFVADAEAILGCDPHVDLVDHILARAAVTRAEAAA
ncbi:MAG: ATP-grasp domain-containing protein [Nitriliruptorales bacterium]